jgi:hypothetical protein
MKSIDSSFDVVTLLEDTNALSEWVDENSLKLNLDYCK